MSNMWSVITKMNCDICDTEMEVDNTYIHAMNRPDIEVVSEPMIEKKYQCICGNVFYLLTKCQNDTIT